MQPIAPLDFDVPKRSCPTICGVFRQAPAIAAGAAVLLSWAFAIGFHPIWAAQQTPTGAAVPRTSPPASRNDDLASIRDQIQKLRVQLASPDVGDDVRSRLEAELTAIEKLASKIEEYRANASRDQASIASIDKTSVELDRQLVQAEQLQPKRFPAESTIEALDDSIRTQKQKIEQLQKSLADVESRLSERPTRRQELRMRLVEIADQRTQSADELKSLGQDDTSLDSQVRRLELQTTLLALDAEQAAIEAELARWDAEESKSTLRRQRELLNRMVKVAKQQVELWEADLAERRRKQAEEAARQAQLQEQAVLEQHPILGSAYACNTQLANDLKEIEALIAEAKAEANRLSETSSNIASLYRDARLRVEAVGLSSSIGAMLRKRKDELPSILSLQMQLQSIRQKIDNLQLRSFEVDQQLEELSLESLEKEILASALADVPPNQVAQRRSEIQHELESLTDELNRLKDAREERLTQLDEALDRYGEILWDSELAVTKLIKLTSEFRDYINERILWIRSNRPLFSELSIDESDRKAFDLAGWTNVAVRTWRLLKKNPLPFFVTVLASFLLLLFKPTIRNQIDELGREAASRTCDTIWPTLRVLALSLLLALALPILPLVLGLAIVYGESSADRPLFLALGQALLAVAYFAIPVEFTRQMCRPRGLAHSHFDWNDQAVLVLQRNLKWLTFVGTILVFVVVLFKSLNPKHEIDLIERIVFVIGMLVTTWFIYRVFHPRQGIWSEYLKTHERSWANQLSGLWFNSMLAVPLGLAVLAIVGYYFTALNLVNCAYATMVFAIVVETTRSLIARFILMGRRHRHIQSLLRRREAERKKREVEAAESMGDDQSPNLDKSVADLVESADMDTMEIAESARHAEKLLSITMALIWVMGMWAIWTEVLPAVKQLDQYTLWHASIVATGSSSGAQPASEASDSASDSSSASGSISNAVTSRTPDDGNVTLRDLLIALMIATVTLVAAKNLPSALEMFLLEQMPFDRTMRYAIKSLISYGLVMFGVIFAFRAIHISWSNVQWLATALTFGLAFGLQEIFANFVAGIILMLERPMRLGDWVTVDDHTGVVTRIRTRATTITTLDRKEYVVPNKDLITGRLVNWTLSDTLNRVDVKVGVAYGSDMETAKRLLLDVARRSKHVVDDPPPSVAFDLFGDNSLNLTLRGFLRTIDERITAIDELHTEINRVFAEAQIEIAFPQRDLHLRSIDPHVEKVLGKFRAEPERDNDAPGPTAD